MDLQLINPSPRYRPPRFDPSPPNGYLHLAGSVAAPARAPFVRDSPAREALLVRLARLAHEVATSAAVTRVSVYRAVLMPPTPRESGLAARYDVAVLIDAQDPDLLDEVRAHPAYVEMLEALTAAADMHVMAATSTRSFGALRAREQGLYLFNHFVADRAAGDAEALTALWEHLAGWYVAETGLSNSLLLRPIHDAEGDGDYVFVNHARFDIGLPRLAAAQFGRKSFRTYVRANLEAHHLVAMPVLYRLHHTETSPLP